MSITIIYPPFTDYQQPPLGPAVLTSYLKSQGFYAKQVDLNIETYDAFLTQSGIRSMSEDIEPRLNKPECEYGQYLYLSMLAEAIAPNIDWAVAAMRGPAILGQGFWAVKGTVDSATLLVHQVARLGQMCHQSKSIIDVIEMSYSSMPNDLVMKFLNERLGELISDEVVGISIAYPSQLAYGLYVAKYAKETWGSTVVLGGATITGIAQEGLLPLRIFDYVDYCVVGDGFAALESILSGKPLPPSCISASSLQNGGSVSSDTDPNDIPIPCFKDLPLARYLSPRLMLPIYPSRGCYWGRCSFCTVSEINPTFTERAASKIVEDMVALHASFGADHFYMSCDVLTVNSMVEVARRIREEGLRFKWQSEARLEEELSDERIHILSEGGCEILKFGLESGSCRTIHYMRKGIKVHDAKRILARCKHVGIRTAVYVIIGFPTENSEDLDATLAFLRDNASTIDYIGLHRYVLNHGSEVYSDPSAFGIVSGAKRNEITSELEYQTQHGITSEQLRNTFEEIKAHLKKSMCNEIPFCPIPRQTCVEEQLDQESQTWVARRELLVYIPALGLRAGQVVGVDARTGDMYVDCPVVVH